MRKELHHIANIERYLDGALNASERRAFEQQLRTDASLRADVQLQRQLVQRLREEAFLADVSAQHQAFTAREQTATAPLSPSRPNWLLSGLLLLLVGSGVGIFYYYWAGAGAVKAAEDTLPTVVEEPMRMPTQASSAPEQLAAAFQPTYQRQRMHAKRTQTISLQGLNAILTIPANALVDADGKVVTGSYDLKYRALDGLAEQAITGLPLLQIGDQAQGLQSVTLFDIRATQDGSPLYLAEGKALSIDLAFSEREEGLALYQLEESTRNWTTQEQAVAFPPKGAYTEALDSIAYKKALREYEIAVEQRNKGITREGHHLDVGTTALRPEGIEKLPDLEQPDPSKYFVRHYKNPRLVQGLQLPEFGVYNCARAYQVQHQVAVAARYTDQQQQVIDNASVLSVVDLDYGAAYSFEPSQFICNGQANNIFLVWTQDGALYSFVKRATVHLKTGAYSFKMERLSERIEGAQDLRQYLHFVRQKVQ